MTPLNITCFPADAGSSQQQLLRKTPRSCAAGMPYRLPMTVCYTPRRPTNVQSFLGFVPPPFYSTIIFSNVSIFLCTELMSVPGAYASTTIFLILLNARGHLHRMSDLELVQLLWSHDGHPRFLHRATCPTFQTGQFGEFRPVVAGTQLDGDVCLVASGTGFTFLWNWREDTWGIILPDPDYSTAPVSNQSEHRT